VNVYALGAGVAAAVLVIAHGAVGHGWHRAQLRYVTFAPTTIVGDADSARRFFGVTWHLVTVFFGATAVALFAIGSGQYTSPEACRFIALTYAAVIAVAMAYFAPRLRAILKPIPAIASLSMVALVLLAWLGAA
jgi:hypothetical protein